MERSRRKAAFGRLGTAGIEPRLEDRSYLIGPCAERTAFLDLSLARGRENAEVVRRYTLMGE